MSTRTDVISNAHDWTRNYARVAGAAYLVTFAASIPAVLLLQPLLNNSTYVITGNANTRVATGLLLDVVNAIACIATAVAVFPVIRRHYEALALGFVASRIMEAAIIMIGVVSLLAVLTLRRHPEGAIRPRYRPQRTPLSPSATGHSTSDPICLQP